MNLLLAPREQPIRGEFNSQSMLMLEEAKCVSGVDTKNRPCRLNPAQPMKQDGTVIKEPNSNCSFEKAKPGVLCDLSTLTYPPHAIRKGGPEDDSHWSSHGLKTLK